MVSEGLQQLYWIIVYSNQKRTIKLDQQIPIVFFINFDSIRDTLRKKINNPSNITSILSVSVYSILSVSA